MTAREALSRRLNRVYGLLFAVLVIAWLVKVTAFTPETNWEDAAALPGVPGPVVAAALALLSLAVVAVARWPTERRATGEIYETEPGDWKTE